MSDRIKELADKRRARLAAEKQTAETPTEENVEGLEDLVDTETQDYFDALDRFKEEMKRLISIGDAYERWWPGYAINYNGKEPMFRCPAPDHTDDDPSASFDPETNLWRCHKCEIVAGDIFNLAAYYLGKDYKTDFSEISKFVADEFGFQITKPRKGRPPELIKQKPIVRVLPSVDSDEEDEEEPEQELDIKYPHLFVEDIHNEDSIFFQYRKLLESTPISLDYGDALAAVIIAALVGRHVYLQDYKPIYTNQAWVLLGPTSAGKTTAIEPMRTLIRKHLPFTPQNDAKDNFPLGVNQIAGIDSPQVLLDRFDYQINPTLAASTGTTIRQPVNGIVYFGEMSGLMGRMKGTSLPWEDILHQFLDGDSIITLQSRKGGYTEAFEPSASFVTTTQIDTLHKNLEQRHIDSGFANRWLYVGGRTRSENYNPSIGTVTLDTTDLERVMLETKDFIDNTLLVSGKFGYTVEPKANEIYTKWALENVPSIRFSEDGNKVNPRIDVHIKRMMLWLAIDRKEPVITARTATDATERYAPYFLKMGNLVNQEVTSTGLTKCENDILAAIRASSEPGPSAAELYDRIFRRKYNRTQVMIALDTLQNSGEVTLLANYRLPNAKRSTDRYCLSRNAHKYQEKISGVSTSKPKRSKKA